MATKKKRPKTLREWFDGTLPSGMSKSAYAELLAKRSRGRVSASTIWNTLKGQRITGYAKGLALSDLTGGEVPLTEIVDT